MKIKAIIAILAGVITYTILHFAVMGYGNIYAHVSINHEINKKFEDKFIKSSSRPEKFKKYWINFTNGYSSLEGMAVTNYGLFESTYGEELRKMSMGKWIEHGGLSADEPEVPASVRHFYDPKGLKGGKKYLTNRGTYWEGLYTNPGIDAIEWAFGDTPKGAGNDYTWVEGKKFFVQAFQEKDSTKRENLLAKAFRCLGEVLHNTGDMGCPSHVRNDSHAAPAGLSWGWAFGSPDPYEELLLDAFAGKYSGGSPDPSLEAFFASATTARSINERLALFTNENFFSHETISGMGVKQIKPANGEAAYDSPKLDNLTYDPIDFTFYKTFPSGRKVKMCKDHSYFRFRGYPYIDKACVYSQAAELTPNIISAGINIVRLFIPAIEVQLENADDLSDTLDIRIIHTPDLEYKDSIKYNGEIRMWINGKLSDSIAIAEKGVYRGTIFPIKNGDKIKASINLGDITIESEELVVKMDPLWGIWEITEKLVDSDDPVAPEKGTEFKGTKFYKVRPDGKIEISNLDGSSRSVLYYVRTGSVFRIHAEVETQSYDQNGSVASNQESWTANTESKYQQTVGSEKVWYFRKYSASGKRKK
jgi:hypothetical protein